MSQGEGRAVMLSLAKGSAQDREERALLLSQCAETLGHGFSADQLDGYLHALADVPLVHLRLGLELALRKAWPYRFPQPGQLRECIDQALAKLPAPVEDDDPRVTVYCATCADTGLAYVRDGRELRHSEAHGAGLSVRPCGCRDSNPAIRRRCERRTRYAEEQR